VKGVKQPPLQEDDVRVLPDERVAVVLEDSWTAH